MAEVEIFSDCSTSSANSQDTEEDLSSQAEAPVFQGVQPYRFEPYDDEADSENERTGSAGDDDPDVPDKRLENSEWYFLIF